MAKAKTRLSEKATLVQRGYGQVEGNHLTARYNGKILAQLPAAQDIEILENGMFAKYDYAKGVVDFETENTGDWLLVFNEVKVYEVGETDADFAMIKGNYGGYYYNAAGVEMPEGTSMVPRLLKTDVGDIMTTNCIVVEKGPEDENFSTETFGESGKLKVGATLTVGEDGYLKVNDAPSDGEMVWTVVKQYTMPDGQPGVKLIRTV